MSDPLIARDRDGKLRVMTPTERLLVAKSKLLKELEDDIRQLQLDLKEERHLK